MDEKQKDIIKKIQKLLKLAEKAGTEDEAKTAMLRVRELLAKYNLSLGDVKAFAEDDCNEAAFTLKSRYCPSHIKMLVNACCALCGCKAMVAYYLDGNINRIGLNFIGVGADAIVACQTFQFLLHFAKRKILERNIKKAEKSDYYYGFSLAVLERALAIKKSYSESAQENALVPLKDAAIKKYTDKRYGNAKAVPTPRLRHASKETLAGMEDGNNANLDRPVIYNQNLALE